MGVALQAMRLRVITRASRGERTLFGAWWESVRAFKQIRQTTQQLWSIKSNKVWLDGSIETHFPKLVRFCFTFPRSQLILNCSIDGRIPFRLYRTAADTAASIYKIAVNIFLSLSWSFTETEGPQLTQRKGERWANEIPGQAENAGTLSLLRRIPKMKSQRSKFIGQGSTTKKQRRNRKTSHLDQNSCSAQLLRLKMANRVRQTD